MESSPQDTERKTIDDRQRMSDLERLRHSCAHVMATAIARLWPDAQFAAGPFRLILAPELIRTANDYFLIRDTLRFYSPPVPKNRAGKAYATDCDTPVTPA